MTPKPIPYGRQQITPDDIQAVVEVLTSDFLTQGPKIAEFERAFAEYTGAAYAAAVTNGTAALHLGALALGVKPGVRVITSPLTFAASANAVLFCGGRVDFVDIDKNTYLMDSAGLEEKLAGSPPGTYQGVIPVDFAGYPVDGKALREIADRYGLWILEDACHAPGSFRTDETGAKRLAGDGVFSDLAMFSFHPVKHIATGEGGMITTNRKALWEKILILRTHGITKSPDLLSENHGGWYYEMQELGFNYRIPDINCALGISQLKRLGESLSRRNAIARRYDAAFAGAGIVTPKVEPGCFHAYHLYVIQSEDRLGLYNHLRANGVFAQVHYLPVHLHPYYRFLGWKKGDFPVAEAYYERCLSLPMFPALTDGEQDFVIEKVIEFRR